MGVKGNERVDEAAIEVTERPGIRRCPERFVSVAHVNSTITERNWKEDIYWFKAENDRRPLL